jgi:hypothetical protein
MLTTARLLDDLQDGELFDRRSPTFTTDSGDC